MQEYLRLEVYDGGRGRWIEQPGWQLRVHLRGYLMLAEIVGPTQGSVNVCRFVNQDWAWDGGSD
jgi:hypothetical protein